MDTKLDIIIKTKDKKIILLDEINSKLDNLDSNFFKYLMTFSSETEKFEKILEQIPAIKNIEIANMFYSKISEDSNLEIFKINYDPINYDCSVLISEKFIKYVENYFINIIEYNDTFTNFIEHLNRVFDRSINIFLGDVQDLLYPLSLKCQYR